jgi:hypothetical protein
MRLYPAAIALPTTFRKTGSVTSYIGLQQTYLITFLYRCISILYMYFLNKDKTAGFLTSLWSAEW